MHGCKASQMERQINYFDFLAIDLNGLHGKVDANGVALVLGICATLEPLNDARLASAAVADKHNFEQKVEIVLGWHSGDSGYLLLRRRRR